jgi:hypothetical protein
LKRFPTPYKLWKFSNCKLKNIKAEKTIFLKTASSALFVPQVGTHSGQNDSCHYRFLRAGVQGKSELFCYFPISLFLGWLEGENPALTGDNRKLRFEVLKDFSAASCFAILLR